MAHRYSFLFSLVKVIIEHCCVNRNHPINWEKIKFMFERDVITKGTKSLRWRQVWNAYKWMGWP